MPAFDARPGHILVQVDSPAAAAAVSRALDGLSFIVGKLTGGTDIPAGGGLLRVALGTSGQLEHVLNVLSRLPGVRYAEPDYALRTFGDEDPGVTDLDVSNDPGVTGGQAWGMYGDL